MYRVEQIWKNNRDAVCFMHYWTHGTEKKPDKYLLHRVLKPEYSSAGTEHTWAILHNHLEKSFINLWKDWKWYQMLKSITVCSLMFWRRKWHFIILSCRVTAVSLSPSDIQIRDHIFLALRKIKVEHLNELSARQPLVCIATYWDNN